MATLEPMARPTRQPFGVIGASRLKALDSMKNYQNGVKRSSPLKRSLDDPIFDEENIAPVENQKNDGAKDGLNKRNKTAPEDDVATSKFILTTTPPARKEPLQTSSPSSLEMVAPDNVIGASPAAQSPLTPPAGRSPPRHKTLRTLGSRRPLGVSPQRHFRSPALMKQHHGPRVPFSVAAALSGTLSSPTQPFSSTIPKQSSTLNPDSNRRKGVRKTLEPSLAGVSSKARRLKAWDFEIHVDTPEEEITNLMQHSTSILDISDDGKLARERKARGKENIPPAEADGQEAEQYTGPVTRSRAQNAAGEENVEMTDRPRSALGELDPKDFATDEQVASDAENVASSEEGDDAEENDEDESKVAEVATKETKEEDENTNGHDASTQHSLSRSTSSARETSKQSTRQSKQAAQPQEEEQPTTRRLTRAAAASLKQKEDQGH